MASMTIHPSEGVDGWGRSLPRFPTLPPQASVGDAAPAGHGRPPPGTKGTAGTRVVWRPVGQPMPSTSFIE